ncbi:hypothetical protein ACFPZP_11840 [Citrobacter bitternis]|uniref:Uncharacterized protein n=1 Tax=Citrobacter bitternis TaxID=1585982 RepID=A0ABW1PZZ8_9ENTR
MNIIRRAIIWLLTKHETKTMVDQIVDVPVADPVPAAVPVEAPAPVEPVQEKQPSAFDVLKSSFAAKVQFIEAGLAALGEEAEEELVALAEKYL